MIDLETFCRKTGISKDTARRRIKSGELVAELRNGKYFIDMSFDGSDTPTQREKLKDMLTAAQIKKITQSLKEGEENIRADERTKFKEKIFEAMKAIPAAYREAKLSEAQFTVIQKAWDDSIKRFQELTV